MFLLILVVGLGDASRVDAEVLRLLRGPTGRTTMVVTLHQPDLARRHCTRVIGLRGGRVVLDRPVGELDDAHLDELYQSA